MQKKEEKTLNQTPLDPNSNKRVLLVSGENIQSVNNPSGAQSNLSNKPNLSSHHEEAEIRVSAEELVKRRAMPGGVLYDLQSTPYSILSPFKISRRVIQSAPKAIAAETFDPHSNIHPCILAQSEPSNPPALSNSSSYHDDSSFDYLDAIDEINDQSQNEEMIGDLAEKEEKKEEMKRRVYSGDILEPKIKEANIFRKQAYISEKRAKGIKTFKEILKFPDISHTLSTSAFSSIFRYMKKLIGRNKGKIVALLLSIGYKKEIIEDCISAFDSYDLYNRNNIQLKTLKQLICKIFKERSIYAYLMQLSLGVTLKSIDKSEFTRFSRTNLPSYKRIVEVCYKESIRVLSRRISIPDVNKKLQFISV